MKLRLMFSFLLAAVVFGTVRADAQSVVSRTYSIPAFDAVNVRIPVDIVYVPGGTGLEIVASDKVLKNIVAEVDGRRLVIKSARRSFKYSGDIKVYLSSPRLNRLTIDGSAEFSAPRGMTSDELSVTVNGSGDVDVNGLKSESLSLQINGSGDIEMERLVTGNVSVQINGSGDVDLKGTASDVSVDISGSGDVDISDLKTGKVNTKIQGSGSVKTFDD